jgi:hypothetical protein
MLEESGQPTGHRCKSSYQTQRVGLPTQKETMPKTQFITVRLPEDIMVKLKAEARRNTRSLSAQVLHYIRLELDKKASASRMM